jgi:hypothetical protein
MKNATGKIIVDLASTRDISVMRGIATRFKMLRVFQDANELPTKLVRTGSVLGNTASRGDER